MVPFTVHSDTSPGARLLYASHGTRGVAYVVFVVFTVLMFSSTSKRGEIGGLGGRGGSGGGLGGGVSSAISACSCSATKMDAAVVLGLPIKWGLPSLVKSSDSTPALLMPFR
jgi:hypothetical protein